MTVADAGPWDPGGGGVEERLRVAASGTASGVVEIDACLGRDGAGDLDPKTSALVRLAALVAMGSSAACYQELVCAAVELGATEQEVIDTMIAVASTIGMARLVSASPRVALGLGYDVEAAFEGLHPDSVRPVEPGAPVP
jgi:4-carboxymuconolactone decarboxylase